MWKLVYGSVKGTSHAHSGQPCQDFCVGAEFGAIVVGVCADGAGSAGLSQVGSKTASERFMDLACRGEAPTRESLETWVDAAREAVLKEADARGVPPRQLACTLLGAIAGDDYVAFAQVGDGVMVFDGEDGYQLAFWPDNGEYANMTRFLTDDDYRKHLRIELLHRRISELAVLTDGLQMLALDFSQGRVHDRFFAPLFEATRNGPNGEALRLSLMGFLDSKRVNDRTDDDKSLLLATRITDGTVA